MAVRLVHQRLAKALGDVHAAEHRMIEVLAEALRDAQRAGRAPDEQRYLERLRRDPAMADCRGVLAAQAIKPQAKVLAESRGIAWVEVDLAVLRGEREPELTLFAA